MNFSHFDLNLLKALDVLLEEKNVTRAGERLFITQQAASSALNRLRSHFDDELLVRVGRKLELTPLARSLAVPVHEALYAARMAIETRPDFDPLREVREFSVAMSDYSIAIFLPRIIRKLAVAAPGFRVNVRPFNKESFNLIDSGRIDYCITANDWRLYGERRSSSDIQSRILFTDDFVCVADKDLLPGRESLDLETYVGLAHNSVFFGEGIATLVERAWKQADLDIDVVLTVPTFSALITVLPGTRMIATTQRKLANALAPPLGLQILECPLGMPPLEQNIFWHRRSANDPANKFFVQSIVEAGATM
ncbi:LysR family transcriptional regulator [Sphingosinicella sp.]|uniref:LysR family transcriptional regulator n=1 Tax=Sphingosinicella sp. TaxID=1917971 RepID=UPI0018117A4D|nr:LysR family transcriptional regulator [Sphingosinicella sp.]MBA4759008.1 LysR family transcriptional regulator [Sphingosinicella sp.]